MQDLPKSRLQDILEAVDDAFDTILTAECSEKTLLQAIYILTRTRPMTGVKGFRIKSYQDLNEKFQTRALSIARFDGDSVYQARKDAIRMLSAEQTSRVATECHWDDDWLKQKRGPRAATPGKDPPGKVQKTLTGDGDKLPP